MRARIVLIPMLVLGAVACGGAAHGKAAAPRPTTTTTAAQGVELPYQEVAELAACPADAETLKLAEQSYSTLNGSFATIQQLFAGQYIKAPSTYFVAVKMGIPRGGYTLIGGPKCGSVPVVP